MVKYIKIENDADIVELTDDGEMYCYKCEHFTAPNRCYGFMEVTRPFGVCEEWIEADVKQIEDNRRDVDTCCVYNAQQRLQNTFIDIERL